MGDGPIRRRRPEDRCDYCGAAPTRPCRDLRTGKQTALHAVIAKGLGRVVLGRRVGQAIYVGDDIRVTVTKIGGSWAQVMIEAPRSVPVVREETLDRPRPPRVADEEESSG